MTQWLGDYVENETVYFLWSTNDSNGASITRAVDGTVQVYKDNNVAQSVAGITDTEDFDGLTGIHACTIDLSADVFYAIGADYAVVLNGATIDGESVNAVLAHFSIENRFDEVDVTQWLGTAAATPTVAGVPEVDVTHWRGVAVPAPTIPGVPEADITHIEGAAVDSNSAQLGANMVQISSDATAADNCEAWFDDSGFNASNSEIGTVASLTALGAGAITAATIATNAIDADALATDAVNEIADGLLTRDWNSVAGEASRSTLNALRTLRNKVTVTTTTITVFEEDDTTTAWLGDVTTNASANLITEIDPT